LKTAEFPTIKVVLLVSGDAQAILLKKGPLASDKSSQTIFACFRLKPTMLGYAGGEGWFVP